MQSALGQIAKDAKPADALVVMLIGHGSFDGFEYKINLPGPDFPGWSWRRCWIGFRPRGSSS